MAYKIADKILTKEEFKIEFIKIFKPRKYRAWFIKSNIFGKLEANSLDDLILKYNKLVN